MRRRGGERNAGEVIGIKGQEEEEGMGDGEHDGEGR